MSIIYISSFYPSREEPFRGHYVEKQAKLLSEKLDENLFVIIPVFNSKIIKPQIKYNKFNNVDVINIYFPNFYRNYTIHFFSRLSNKIFTKTVMKLIGRDYPKIIVSNDFWATLIYGNILKNTFGCFHFNIVHGETITIKTPDFLVKDITRELSICDGVFAVSKKIKNYIYKNTNFKGKVTVIPNGLSKEIILKYENYEFIKNSILTIVSIGNLNYNKGFDIVLEALNQIKIPFKYYIIGDGEYKNKLLEMINKYNLNDKVFFTGNINNDDVFKYLEKSHYFILPSRNEAFGIVYLEAMITKNITIATVDQGPSDFISNGINGFLINNEKDIVKIISRMTPENAKSICEDAFTTAKRFEWNNNVNMVINYIKNIQGRWKNEFL